MSDRFFYATNGVMDGVMKLIRYASKKAIEKERTKIGDGRLRRNFYFSGRSSWYNQNFSYDWLG
jgi:hypothetical protein